MSVTLTALISPITEGKDLEKNLSEPALATTHKPKKLKRFYGYMLVNIDAEGVAPSIHFIQKGAKRGTKTIAPTRKGLYLIPVLAADYWFSTIEAPLYNLPYRLDLHSKIGWDFKIEKKKINYVGKITISKEREKNRVNIERTNLLATDLQEIKEKYSELLKTYPFTQGFGPRDDFLNDYLDIEIAQKR